MSLYQAHHSTNWRVIPRKCKECQKSIYTIEDDNIVLYQCSIHGAFKRYCDVLLPRGQKLPTPQEITKR